MLGLCRRVFPHAEGHKFYIEHWATSLYFNKIREVGAVLAENGFFPEADDVFYLNIHEVRSAISDLGLAWAGGAPARGVVYWPPRVARRKEILATLAECLGNRTQTAKKLGISRRALIYKLRAIEGETQG